MNDFFDKLNAFIEAAREQAADAAHKGAEALRHWADYLENIAGPTPAMTTSSDLSAKVAACEAGLNDLKKAKATGPGSFDPTVWLALFQTILDLIKNWRKPKP